MAYNKRRAGYGSRKTDYNYVWQAMPFSENLSIPAGTEGSVHNGVITDFRPGIGSADSDADAFKDDHVLERIRGSMAHNGYVQTAPLPTDQSWFPFTMAALKIPTGFAAQDIDLFDNSEGDDFAFRMDAVCNVARTDAIPNWHPMDSKAKRRFSVGDTLSWIYSLVRPISGSFRVEISVNARVLWKLRM